MVVNTGLAFRASPRRDPPLSRATTPRRRQPRRHRRPSLGRSSQRQGRARTDPMIRPQQPCKTAVARRNASTATCRSARASSCIFSRSHTQHDRRSGPRRAHPAASTPTPPDRHKHSAVAPGPGRIISRIRCRAPESGPLPARAASPARGGPSVCSARGAPRASASRCRAPLARLRRQPAPAAAVLRRRELQLCPLALVARRHQRRAQHLLVV